MTFGFRPLESKTNQSSMNSSNAGFEGCYRVLHIFLDGSAAVCQQRAPIGSHMLLKDSLIMATTPLICRCSVKAGPRRPNSDWVQFKSISYFEHSWHVFELRTLTASGSELANQALLPEHSMYTWSPLRILWQCDPRFRTFCISQIDNSTCTCPRYMSL